MAIKEKLKTIVYIVRWATIGCFLFILSAYIVYVLIHYSRGQELFPNNFSFSRLIKQHDDVKEKSKVVTLSYSKPNFAHMVQQIANNSKVGHGFLRGTGPCSRIDYYEKASVFYPDVSGIHDILGFCYYHNSQDEKAVKSYQESIRLNSHNFWPFYNLGVIYFHGKEYEKAYAILQKAFQLKPAITLKIINTVGIYRQIWGEGENVEGWMNQGLKTSYTDAFKLMLLSQYYLKNFSVMVQMANYAISSGLEDQGFFYYYAGLAAFLLEEHEKSVVFFQKYIESNKGQYEPFYYLGMSLKAMGMEENSKRFLSQATFLQKAKQSAVSKGEEIGTKIF